MKKLLHNLIDKEDRSAHFKTVIALNLKGETHLFTGAVEGEIIKTQNGDKGFGYDPIFKPNGYEETFAQLPIKTKNAISHRGIAFKKLIKYLSTTNAR